MNKLIYDLRLSDSVNIIVRQRVESVTDDRPNIVNLLSKHDVIMSYSRTESFHYAFAEGLLSGLQGFYNMWDNDLISCFWKDYGYNAEDSMLHAIRSWFEIPLDKRLEILAKNRHYIMENFSSKVLSQKYLELFGFKDIS
jgi:glycosyltransferase involved in cell wall biosynthesis